MFIIIVFCLGCDRPSGLLLFVRALLLSILTLLFLPSSSVSLSYFVLAVPMRECLRKHSCMGSLMSYSHTEWYLPFFAKLKLIVCNLGRSFVYQNQIKLNYTININISFFYCYVWRISWRYNDIFDAYLQTIAFYIDRNFCNYVDLFAQCRQLKLVNSGLVEPLVWRELYRSASHSYVSRNLAYPVVIVSRVRLQ